MAADDWIPTTLGAEADLLTGFPFKSNSYSRALTDIRLLRGDNIAQGHLRWEGARRWPSKQVDDFHSYLLQQEDVVLAMDRPWIEAGLKYAAITEDDVPSLLVQRVARLRGGPRLKTSFLRYLIGSPRFSDHVLSLQTGTAVPHISGGQIKAFRFLRPPIQEQEALAQALGSLDGKIEINKRTNRTLEAMARAIFKSWFVDFELRRIRWKLGIVSDLALLQRKILDPLSHADELFDHYSIPAFDGGRVPIQEAGHKIKSSKFVVPSDAILVSKLNPRIFRVWGPRISSERRSISSTEFLVVSTRENDFDREYLYSLFSSTRFAETLASRVTGTSGSHQRVRPNDFLALELVIPDDESRRLFSTAVKPMLDRVAANLEENRTLATIRDTLLPKLLSGEIRVKGAEKTVRNVA